jgi:hypothetical protein
MNTYFEPHDHSYRTLPISPLPTHIINQVDEISTLLNSWSSSFDCFLAGSTSLTSRDLIAITQLRLLHQFAEILNSTCHNFFQCSYDQYLPQFSSIVSFAASILEYTRTSRSHGGLRVAADVGIIQPLHFLTLKCRDRRTRRQAIALVEQAGREGVWDGVSSSAVLRWVVDKEEEGLTPLEEGLGVEASWGEVPEERDRFHRVNVEFYRRERRVLIKAMRRRNNTQDWDDWECVGGETRCWGPPKEVSEGFTVVTAIFS